MHLTILVPTYNRAHLVHLQLINILNIRNAVAELDIDIDVVVSDNYSDPPVEIPPACTGFVRLVKPERHLISGEANIISAIGKCEGDYIWTLSDDDSPIIHNVVALLQDIISQQPDMVIANCSSYLKQGVVIKSQIVCSDTSKIRDLPDFVSRTGIWLVLTGFSGLIVRRSHLQPGLDRFEQYYDASKIYSYAIFLLDLFWDKKFMFCNRPVVAGSQNEYGTQWSNMAAQEGVFAHFYWTTGFIRQLGVLKASRKVDTGYFSRIIDQGVKHRFHLLSQVCHLLLVQLRNDLSEEPSLARAMTHDEVNEVADFLCSELSTFMQILAPIIKSQDLRSLSIDAINQSIEQIAGLTNRFHESFFIKNFGGWNVYFFDNVYRAVPAGLEYDLLELFRDISPISSRWHLVSSSLVDVELKIYSRPHASVYWPHAPDIIKSHVDTALEAFKHYSHEALNVRMEALNVQMQIAGLMAEKGFLEKVYRKLRRLLARA